MAAAESGLQATEDQSAEGATQLSSYLNAGGNLLSGAAGAARNYKLMSGPLSTPLPSSQSLLDFQGGSSDIDIFASSTS